MGYDGEDRRRHRVYVTRNTEYHFRGAVCVAVRDLRTGRFQPAHIALGLQMDGGFRACTSGTVAPALEEPSVGDAISLLDRTPDGRERQIVTSRVVRIERPPLRDLAAYRR